MTQLPIDFFKCIYYYWHSPYPILYFSSLPSKVLVVFQFFILLHIYSLMHWQRHIYDLSVYLSLFKKASSSLDSLRWLVWMSKSVFWVCVLGQSQVCWCHLSRWSQPYSFAEFTVHYCCHPVMSISWILCLLHSLIIC